MEAIVGSVKIDDDEPDKKPTKVDSTIVGSVIQLLRIEKYPSAFPCNHAKPEHLSASSAMSFSKAEL
jgi:hypothetical protein